MIFENSIIIDLKQGEIMLRTAVFQQLAFSTREW